MVVPVELALQLGHLHVLPVQRGHDPRRPGVRELRERIPQVHLAAHGRHLPRWLTHPRAGGRRRPARGTRRATGRVPRSARSGRARRSLRTSRCRKRFLTLFTFRSRTSFEGSTCAAAWISPTTASAQETAWSRRLTQRTPVACEPLVVVRADGVDAGGVHALGPQHLGRRQAVPARPPSRGRSPGCGAGRGGARPPRSRRRAARAPPSPRWHCSIWRRRLGVATHSSKRARARASEIPRSSTSSAGSPTTSVCSGTGASPGRARRLGRLLRRCVGGRRRRPVLVDRLLVERLHEREEHDLAQILLVGEQGDEAVDAHPPAAHRRHAVLHGAQVVLVDLEGLVVASGPRRGLGLEARALVDRVDELAVGVHDLPPVDHELVAVDPRRGRRRSCARAATGRCGWPVTKTGFTSFGRETFL